MAYRKMSINFGDCDPLEVIDNLAKAVWVDYLEIDARLVWTDKLVGNRGKK